MLYLKNNLNVFNLLKLLSVTDPQVVPLSDGPEVDRLPSNIRDQADNEDY